MSDVTMAPSADWASSEAGFNLPVLMYEPRYEQALMRSRRADAAAIRTIAAGTCGGALGIALVYASVAAPNTALLGVVAALSAMVGAMLMAWAAAKRHG